MRFSELNISSKIHNFLMQHAIEMGFTPNKEKVPLLYETRSSSPEYPFQYVATSFQLRSKGDLLGYQMWSKQTNDTSKCLSLLSPFSYLAILVMYFSLKRSILQECWVCKYYSDSYTANVLKHVGVTSTTF